MLILRRLFVFVIVFAVFSSMLMGQSGARPGLMPVDREMTVEESYLQESIELMIIREQSRTDSRDMKFVALEYIGEAIDRGNRSEEIAAALEFLSMEGVVNVTRENGRVVNNFPDVRKEAAAQLGRLGTPEASQTLLKMVNGDNEPMVITEAIRSLGTIGSNELDEVTRQISWTVNRFDRLNPDNFMALSALEAFEKIAESSGGLRDRSAIDTIIRIAEGNYVRPVQDRARALLNELRRYD